MTAILGITDGDDSGAVLLIDGRIVAAVNEERLTRMKMCIGFPRRSVEEVLKIGGKQTSEVDYVALASFAEKFSPEPRPNYGWFHETSTVVRLRNEIASALARPLKDFRPAYGAYRALKRLTLGRRRAGVKRLLEEMGIRAPISYHDHHRCHALAAFHTSGFEEALSISLDGGGDGSCSHAYSCTPQGARLVNNVDAIHSIGNYYAYVTHICGFRASIHEGKITGLAANGEPIFQEVFAKLINYRDGQIQNSAGLFHRAAIETLTALLPQDWEHKDLAASIQAHLEAIGARYVHHWMRKTGMRKVCLSGGVFGNVRLNQKIAELPGCEAVFVFPAMGDGGLAAGAAYSQWRQVGAAGGGQTVEAALWHVYLGCSFNEREMEQALWSSGLSFERHEDVEDVVARLILDGKVVARFNGAMEYGPRALGNRSILYRTGDPSVNTWLNGRLHRTEFMPFAPSCLAGFEELLFRWNPASATSARFMTITLDCSEWMKEHSPAVVHVDGTARPQIVDRDINPGFFRIIERYHQLSGVPVVVNTSFNMHEEPIVATPEDAIRAFVRGQLDALSLGPFVVTRTS